jgi:adenylate cyclase
MLTCVEASRGVLDKLIGDALMATFGVPACTGDKDDRAVETAIAMMRRLTAWNSERSILGMPVVRIGIGIGIGINTDMAVSGNIGSPERMDYTVIGDGVNLATQLQQVTKLYRAPILISDRTARRLHRKFRLRPVDYVAAKGHDELILVHEVVDHYPELQFPNPDQVLEHYAAGVEFYRLRRFAAALASFEQALVHHPGDHLSRLYVDRCRMFLQGLPPDEVNGVWPRWAA